MTEQRGWLRLLGQGDETAWREFVASFLRPVFGLAYRFTGRRDAAEDLTQEIFLKVFQNIGRFDGDESAVVPWILTVARNHAIDHLRRSPRDESTDPQQLELLPSRSEGPEAQLQGSERILGLYRGLRALPKEFREVLILRDLEGVGYEEIAELLSLPVGTVKSRVSRGRLELARRLGARFK